MIKDSAPKEIHLLAELQWHNKALTAFYGFEILEKLRLEKIVCPIFVYSYLERAYFLNQKGNKFKILHLVTSHPFVQLPIASEASVSRVGIQDLSLRQLDDAIYHYFNPKGTLAELAHELKGKIEEEDKNDAIEHFFEQVENLIPEGHLERFYELREEFIVTANKDDTSRPFLVNRYKEHLLQLLPKSINETTFTYREFSWQILFIDDSDTCRSKVQEAFAHQGLVCHTVSNATDAFQLLEEDMRGELKDESGNSLPPNTIAVVISDIRLKEQEDDWQAMQGYDIIYHIYEHLNNRVAFFVLTSKRGVIVRESAGIKKVQIQWFAKEDVLNNQSENGLNLFCHQVIEAGIQTYESLHQFPKAKQWREPWKNKIDYPLVQYYRKHRMTADYYKKEKWINECAKNYIEEAEWLEISKFKHKIDHLDFSPKFKSGQTQSPKTLKGMTNFYTKLIGRRITMALYLKGWDIGDISDILKYQQFKDGHTDKQLFSTYLALSTQLHKEVPNLLLEERNWIEQELGINIQSTKDRNAYQILKEHLLELQERLHKAGCPDDFVEEKLLIASNESALKYLKIALKLAKAYHIYNFKANLQTLKNKVMYRNDTLMLLLDRVL